MKIVIISPSLDPATNVSGMSSVVNTIISYGHNKYIHYTLGSSDKDKKGFKWLWKLLKSFYRYNLFLKQHNPDLIHMNVPCDTKGILRESAILAISKKNKRKVVVHLHGGEYLMREPNALLKYLFKKILLNSNKVIVLSTIEKESIAKLYGYANAEILHNSVDTLNTPYKIFENNPNRKIQILFLGRIEEAKGIYDMQKAFSLLYAEIPFKFVLCGSDCSKENIIADFRKRMTDDFCYKGIVSGVDKINAILESDIFILPSHIEGLPMSLLETMSMGVVPVVTNIGSMPFVVKNGINGIIIEAHNPEDIYLKVSGLLRFPDKLRELSINARKTIVENFDVRQMTEKLRKIYEDCLFH